MASLNKALLAVAMLLAGGQGAQAGVYSFDVYTGDIGRAFDAVSGSTALFTSAANAQHARFTYTGALDFAASGPQNPGSAGDLNASFFGVNQAGISDYTALTVLSGADYGSFATLTSFLSASGSVAGYGYGSLYMITDKTTNTAGLNLTMLHDDGIGVYSAGILRPGTVTGPTGAITETITLPDGIGYTLAYGRENGAPSVLSVAVPEPLSMTLLGTGLVGLALVRRRRGRSPR